MKGNQLVDLLLFNNVFQCNCYSFCFVRAFVMDIALSIKSLGRSKVVLIFPPNLRSKGSHWPEDYTCLLYAYTYALSTLFMHIFFKQHNDPVQLLGGRAEKIVLALSRKIFKKLVFFLVPVLFQPQHPFSVLLS